MNVNNRNPCKLLSVVIIYNLVEVLIQKTSKSPANSCSQWPATVSSFSLFLRVWPEFVFTFFFLCLIFHFVRKIHRNCSSPGGGIGGQCGSHFKGSLCEAAGTCVS